MILVALRSDKVDLFIDILPMIFHFFDFFTILKIAVDPLVDTIIKIDINSIIDTILTIIFDFLVVTILKIKDFILSFHN
jgi:hypothetical protein